MMERNSDAKKAKNPEASESRIAENKPKSPRGIPRSRAGCAVAVISGRLLCPVEYKLMAGAAQIPLYTAAKVAQEAAVRQADNGMCYATFGEVHLVTSELEQIVQAVPAGVGVGLRH